jgi:circadian clock protein KaiC
VRNMRSIGLHLDRWIKTGLLRFHATRPTSYGLEAHLSALHKLVNEFSPQVVIVDPITNFLKAGTEADAEAMVMRLIDFLKARQITAVFTSLTHGGGIQEMSQAGISSLIDTWILLRDIELGGERNRGVYVLKSRGMPHSNQIREFVLTERGIELKDVYVGPEGVLTGSMRLAQEARERASAASRQQEIERRQRDLDRKRQALEAQIAAQRGQFEAEQEELKLLIAQEQAAADLVRQNSDVMATSRKADAPAPGNGARKRERQRARP